jgi:hypothetical protein
MEILIILFSLLGLGLLIYGFVAYIKALVNAARTEKWVWFVLMLLFWPLFIFYYMGAYTSTSSTKVIAGRKEQT